MTLKVSGKQNTEKTTATKIWFCGKTASVSSMELVACSKIIVTVYDFVVSNYKVCIISPPCT